MHRDLVAMSDKDPPQRRATGEHAAIRAQFSEAARATGREGQRCHLRSQKPRAPFADRVRDEPASLPPGRPSNIPRCRRQRRSARHGKPAPVPKARIFAPSCLAKDARRLAQDASPKTPRPGTTAARSRTSRRASRPSLGRGERGASDEDAVDLDASVPRRARTTTGPTPSSILTTWSPRRGARPRPRRSGPRRDRQWPGTGASRPRSLPNVPGADAPPKHKGSLLMIAAAILLLISAALLYGRLGSKPDASGSPPAAEESVPSPGGTDRSRLCPTARATARCSRRQTSAPAPVEPGQALRGRRPRPVPPSSSRVLEDRTPRPGHRG